MHILFKEHREIERAALLLENTLDENTVADAETIRRVGPLRQNLAMLLHRHLISENEHILIPLAPEERRGIPGYTRVTKGTVELRLAYSAHVAHWHHRRIEEDYSGYVAAVKQLLAWMHAHIALEERELYTPGLKILAMRNPPIATSATTLQIRLHA